MKIYIFLILIKKCARLVSTFEVRRATHIIYESLYKSAMLT